MVNHSLIEIIGQKQSPRYSALQINLYDIQDLEELLKKDFEIWSNFDKWCNISLQRLIFEKVLEVYKGKKLDICCDCCDYAGHIDNEFINISDKACYGLKLKYILYKLLNEISLAEERRRNDGTYIT